MMSVLEISYIGTWSLRRIIEDRDSRVEFASDYDNENPVPKQWKPYDPNAKAQQLLGYCAGLSHLTPHHSIEYPVRCYSDGDIKNSSWWLRKNAGGFRQVS